MHHILVVEDNISDAETIKLYLKEAGYKHKLSHTESLVEAFGIIRDTKTDLVLLDLSLVDSKGFDTLRTFLREAPDIPVIVFTGTNNQVVGMQCVKAGAQDFLVKGEFDHRRLVNAIRYALERFKSSASLKKQADELSKNEQRFHDLHRLAQFGDWEMDLVSNAMHWSDQMYDIFGQKPKSFSPSRSDYMSYVHVEDREVVEEFFNESIRTGQAHQIEHRIVIDNRLIRRLLVRSQIRFNEDTNKILLLGSVQDITEQSQNKDQAPPATAIDPLPPSDAAPLSRFSFNLRTPLGSIVNLLYLLEQTTLTPQQQDLLRDLKISVDDLSFMLGNLINLSLITDEQANLLDEQMHSDQFLQHLTRVLDFKSERARTSLKINLAKNFPERLSGDLEKVNQFIYSLIDQAILLHQRRLPMQLNIKGQQKESGRFFIQFDLRYNGKELDLDSEWTPVDNNDWLPLLNSAMSNEERQKLGALTLRKLSEILDAPIQMSANRSNEVRILVDIPLRKVDVENGTSKPHLMPPKSLNILLVEDHILNQIATKKVLTSWSDNVHVDISTNGLEALKDFNSKYDLVLMDLQMPEMDGLTAGKKIREKSKVPIIALTASASKQEEDECLNQGFNSYLAKPVKPHQLYQRIVEVLEV